MLCPLLRLRGAVNSSTNKSTLYDGRQLQYPQITLEIADILISVCMTNGGVLGEYSRICLLGDRTSTAHRLRTVFLRVGHRHATSTSTGSNT